MSKPSIGAAITQTLEKEKRNTIKELTVLEDNSNESIFSFFFSETGSGSSVKNEE